MSELPKHTIESRVEFLESKSDYVEEQNNEKFDELVGKINSAFRSSGKTTAEQFDKISTYMAKRFDDMEHRLEKIEADMVIVRSSLSHVENWTKTNESMFQLTRTQCLRNTKDRS